MVGVGVGSYRVLAEDEQALDISRDHLGETLGCIGALPLGDLNSPMVLEALHHFSIGEFLIAREIARGCTHITGALHVVLSTDRVDARPWLSEVACDHSQVRQRHYAFSATSMLGNTKAVHDSSGTRFPIQLCRGNQIASIDAADFRHVFRCVLFHHRLEVVKTFRAFCDKRLIDKTLVNKHPCNTIGKRNIGARVQFQMNIGFSRKTNIARIDHDKFCSRFDRVTDLHADNRMGFLWVRANQHDHISVTSDVGNRIGHSARTKGLSQTSNRRAMANASAVIDVVRFEHRTCHFLKHVDVFIGRASTRKRSKGLTAKLIAQ